MFELRIDMRPFEQETRRLRAAQDQISYALALALNKANENARNLLMQEWPRHVKARNSGFIGYALRRGPPATKHNLRIEIYDRSEKAFVKRLDKGGMHTAKKSNLAIPVEGNVRVGSHGVRSSQQPRNLTDVFVADRNGRGQAIWRRVGRGKRKLKLMYVLKPAVQVSAKMPFTEDFTTSVLNETRTSFPAAMARAMKSRRVT
jgi:hypothetical protein